jgi:gliding motility-associated lipoprotein GldH
MKTRLLFTIIILFLATFFACRNDIRLSASKSFDGAVWERFDYLHFDFQIDEPQREYNVHAFVRYNEDFTDEKLPVNVVMVMPSGEERIREYVLELRDETKKPLGVSGGGYYELTVSLRRGLTITETGKMQVEIENLRSKAYTKGVVAFGIILEAQ